MTPAATPEDVPLLLHAYVDGELDPANAIAIEQRIATDPALAAEYRRVLALQQLVRERLSLEEVPSGLQSRIAASIGLGPPRAGPSWRAFAASIAVTAVLASGVTWFARSPQSQDLTRDAVVAAHIRSLMTSQPADVVSSDQHTVKPWFNGRIPEAPRVVDLSRQDFPLIGGRLDVIGRKPVPTIVYRHRRHLISLTAIPAGETKISAASSRTSDGYNIVQWNENGMTYWAVSDLGEGDLGKFAELFRSGARGP